MEHKIVAIKTKKAQNKKKRKGRQTVMIRLVCVFKQQFSVFLEIHVGEKVCRNMCNVV